MGCECRSIEARSIRSLRAWVTGSCELPDTGAGNWTLVLWKHKSLDSEPMNHLNSPALPQRFCFDIFELFCLFLIFGLCCCCSAVCFHVALLLHLSFFPVTPSQFSSCCQLGEQSLSIGTDKDLLVFVWYDVAINVVRKVTSESILHLTMCLCTPGFFKDEPNGILSL